MGGSQYERQLVRTLTECGRTAMRAPSSGSATDRNLPDVLCGTAVEPSEQGYLSPVAKVWCIELKATSKTTAYADDQELVALEAFAEAFGAEPFLAAKFKRQGVRTPFYLVRPADCRRTDGGLYGIPESDAQERAEWVVWTETETEAATVREAADV